MMKSLNYQGILSFGYIYLVVLGILNESFYYSQIGIDILKYSSITDILISPISEVTSSIWSILIFFGFLLVVFLAPSAIAKRKDRAWVQKQLKVDPEMETGEIQQYLLRHFLFLLAIGLMGFYVGTGIGRGAKTQMKIKNNEISYHDRISFMDGETHEVYLLGKNSQFLFYLEEEQDQVLIKMSPLHGGVIKNFIETKTKKKKKE